VASGGSRIVPGKPQTIGELQDRLNSVDTQVRILGIGEGGLIALGFGDLTASIATAEDSPKVVTAIFITLVILAGALLARAWINFHVGEMQVKAFVAEQSGKDMKLEKLDEVSDKRIKRGRRLYRQGRPILWSAIAALTGAGACYIFSAWTWAIE
jgi:hypothetical protein